MKLFSGKFLFYFMTLLVVVFVVLVVNKYLNDNSLGREKPAEEINIGGHTNLALHIHSELEIYINGVKQIIPANIGVSNLYMRPVHTHDISGEIHIEGPCKRDFVLGDFFKIWGKEFNSQCIFEYCKDNGSMSVFVNGIENNEFENIVLRDHQEIRIDYNSK